MPLLPLSLGLVLGILLSYVSGGHPETTGLILTGLFACCLMTLIYRYLFPFKSLSKILPACTYSLFFVLIGFCKLELEKDKITTPEHLSDQVNTGTIFKSTISESGYQTIHLSLEKSFVGEKQFKTSGNVMLTLDTLEGIYKPGDVVAFKSRIEPFRNETNPGSFDAEYYYRTHHYAGRAFIASNCISKTGSGNNIQVFFSKRQEEISRKMKEWLPEPVAGIGIALLLGNKADIDTEILDSFSNTGAMHVLAVSGLHVGIILFIFQYILGFFNRWITKKQSILLSVILIWAFGLLSGGSPSVIRAVVMFSILATGQLLNRKSNGMNHLILSAILLLMYDPFYLFDIGFQLSYVALIGILLFQTPVYKLLYFKQKWLDWLWKGSAVGLAATIATTPFMLYWFRQFPNYFLFSNMVVMLLGFIVLLFLILLLFTAWIPYLNILVVFLTVLTLQALVTGIQFVDKIPGGVSGGFELNFLQFLVIGGLIGYCFYLLLMKQQFPKIALTGLCLCLLFISWKRQEKFDKNELRIFSSKAFCGAIQYRGQLITFTENTPKRKQVELILKNAVRESGLRLNDSIVLKSGNKLQLDGKKIFFIKKKNGWKITVNKQAYHYITSGTPEKNHPKELLSRGLQHYLYEDERIEPFCIPI